MNKYYYIINLFNRSNHAQLIYTAHNTHLLNTDFQRRDQVYFVNKRDDGCSELYSLYDFKDFRDNYDMEKAYLQGRFDAIPYLSIPNIWSMAPKPRFSKGKAMQPKLLRFGSWKNKGIMWVPKSINRHLQIDRNAERGYTPISKRLGGIPLAKHILSADSVFCHFSILYPT